MIRVTLAQLNLTVGDLKNNMQLISKAIEQARAERSDLVVFPELTVCSYPPEDLLYHDQFIQDCEACMQEICQLTEDIAIVLGVPRKQGAQLHNSAVFIQNKKIKYIYDKKKLPNYLVFDEMRYFDSGHHPGLIEVQFGAQQIKLGLSICEDIWYEAEPVVQQVEAGADILINISASPYAQGKIEDRINMLESRSKRFLKPLIYCNLIGGQDELIFDGSSVVFNSKGELIKQCSSFKSEVITIDLNTSKQSKLTQPLLSEIYDALVLGTQDYFRKNGFSKAVLGLSGGIDSALTAAIAADALGAKNVTGILMPSRYSSDHSVEDAAALADLTGISHLTIAIEDAHASLFKTLDPVFQDYHKNLTDENLQARIRGVLLMAWANNNNALVLATGNKSEIAVGYCTLYGDMCGAYAPIKDLFKTQVYALSDHINRSENQIPVNTIIKPPSAELRPDQLDTDSLPDYETLDAILKDYIHYFKDAEQIAKKGFDLQLVKRIIRLVDVNEYKRQQAAPGPRVTKMAFGKDRRMPLTNQYRF